MQGLILGHLALQTSLRNRSLFCHTRGREDIDIARLAFCQFALGEVWVLLQGAHHPKVSVFLEFGLATWHRIDEFSRYDVVLQLF